jgi:hypothetical protein
VIPNVVIHLASEQPLLADLFDMPTPADMSLVCTNVRTLDGKKPVFVDRANSVFVFPYSTIRFLELTANATEMPASTPNGALPVAVPAGSAPEVTDELDDVDLELDEDFLRRIREV